MKAITVENVGGPVAIHDRPLPKLRPGYMLVKTAAVAMNPADGVVLDFKVATPGSLLGCDYAGTVVEVGEDVKRSFKKGDRVCGCTRSAASDNHDMGTFAEYIVVKADLQLHVPESMSFEQAASLGVTTLTTGRCLFNKFGISYPNMSEDGQLDTANQPKRLLLVYGGSSAMGTMVIQYAKLANFYVLTTSSPKNMDMVRSYGADVIVDHYSPDGPSEILNALAKLDDSMGRLSLCVDCIGILQSANFCAQVLTPQQAPTSSSEDEILYSVITPLTPEMPGIRTLRTTGYSFLGESHEFIGQHYPASMEDFEAARRFAAVTEGLIAKGLIKPHPVDAREGGFEGVVKNGYPDIRGNKVSGKKIVYSL